MSELDSQLYPILNWSLGSKSSFFQFNHHASVRSCSQSGSGPPTAQSISPTKQGTIFFCFLVRNSGSSSKKLNMNQTISAKINFVTYGWHLQAIYGYNNIAKCSTFFKSMRYYPHIFFCTFCKFCRKFYFVVNLKKKDLSVYSRIKL